jgi:hypothetical protein
MITTAQIKAYLNIADTTYDAFLAQLILEATSIIESYCDQPIKSATVIRNNHYSNNYILLPYSLITSITTVRYRLTNADDYETLTATDYELIDLAGGKYLYLYEFNIGYYEITFVTGYATIPYDIQNVCKEMVAEMYRESNVGKGTLGMSSVVANFDVQSSTIAYKDLTVRYKDRLNKYRRICV